MLYRARILFANHEVKPYNSMEGVTHIEVQTPDLKPLPEKPTEEEVDDARLLIYPLTDLGADIRIMCDGFGCFLAEPLHITTSIRGEPIQLSHLTWRLVGDKWLRVEPIFAPLVTWSTLQELTTWQRLRNWLLGRRCGKCLFFDEKGAQQWRSMKTHTFLDPGGGSEGALNMAMWDDVTKISAEQYGAPDFQEGELGYCPKLDRGVASRLPACKSFKRRG